MSSAIFVDLPNFYSRLLKTGIEEPRFLRDYFLYWLDLDLLSTALTDSFSGIWAFYSGERIGPSSERIDGSFLRDYIQRINSLTGVTSKDVNIPGEQREPIAYKCDSCGHVGKAESKSEKGIDASLTVHLFDTMDSWDIAFLFSGDADFVPAVSSLRRRGKIVIGAGFSDASPALIRECYDYTNLEEAYLSQDVMAYSIFKKDGIASHWLLDDVVIEKTTDLGSLEFWISCGRSRYYASTGSMSVGIIPYVIHFGGQGPNELEKRWQNIMKLKARFGNQNQINLVKGRGYDVAISPIIWASVKRKLKTFESTIEGLTIDERSEDKIVYSTKFQYNPETKQYDLI